MKNFQQVVEVITKSMPREILSFIVDQDILTYTLCGFSIDYIVDVCNIDREYIINTNNRWFGFDGWKETLENPSESQTELMDYINSVYFSMVKKVEKYYERS